MGPETAPWLTEPDRLDWVHAGLPCRLRRNRFGAWCGYVGIDPTHPLFGVSADSRIEALRVHGGVTWVGWLEDEDGPQGRWWIGFDCSHWGDSCPHWPTPLVDPEAVYRTVDYARAECERLAEQVAALQAPREAIP